MGERVSIHFLGTGGSAPFGHRNFPCILVLYRDVAIFLDFGEYCQFSAIRANKRVLSRDIVILLSHAHSDHFSGLPTFLQTLHLSGYRRHLILAVPEEMLAYVNALVEHYEFPGVATIISWHPCIDGRLILDDGRFEVRCVRTRHFINSCGFLIRFLRRKMKPEAISWVPPRARGALQAGFYVSHDGRVFTPDKLTWVREFSILYSGDTLPLREIPPVDVLIHEATFLSEDVLALEKAHSRLKDVIMLSAKVRRELFIVHVSARFSEAEEELPKRLSDKVTIPPDGYSVEYVF